VTTRSVRADDPERLRRFKADFFKALAHPLRIAILELLRDGPLSVGEIADRLGAGGSTVSQQLAVLRSQDIVEAERAGTTVRYRALDPEVYVLLDSGRRIFHGRLSDAVDLLRQVDAEEGARQHRPEPAAS
jgi:ArsR family transcriptional regulator